MSKIFILFNINIYCFLRIYNLIYVFISNILKCDNKFNRKAFEKCLINLYFIKNKN